jgi:ABC-type lipoprotein export system ATPase subunit
VKLEIQGLQHTYRKKGLEERQVLDLPAWEATSGEQILLRGVSGTGKTTLLNILAGLLTPSAGEVWLDGQNLYALNEGQRDLFRARHVGYVFQSHYLLPYLNTLENVTLPLALAQNTPRRTWQKRAEDLLSQLGLGAFLKHRPAQLSTGQRLRVAVARALIHQPPLVLADEPTASLDASAASQVLALLQETCLHNGAILFVASHDPQVAKAFHRSLELGTQI